MNNKNMKSKSYIFLSLILILVGCGLTSCEDEEVEKWESTNISYMLTISPDLLEFVTPEVTYVDSKGKLCRISGVQELDSLVNINYTYTPGIGIWTVQTIKGTEYKCWTLNMTFDKRPFHSFFGVRYKKKELAEISEGKTYDFHHSIFTTTIYAISKFTTTSKIKWYGGVSVEQAFGTGALVENIFSITKDSYYNSEDVPDYLNNLINNPDKAGFYISEDGEFRENNDFQL